MLSFFQAKLLRKLNKVSKLDYSRLTKREIAICSFLKSLNYVDYDTDYDSDESPGVVQVFEVIKSVHITEKGKAYLYERDVFNRRWRITTSIALFALIAAVAAIVLSPFFTAFFSKLYGL